MRIQTEADAVNNSVTSIVILGTPNYGTLNEDDGKYYGSYYFVNIEGQKDEFGNYISRIYVKDDTILHLESISKTHEIGPSVNPFNKAAFTVCTFGDATFVRMDGNIPIFLKDGREVRGDTSNTVEYSTDSGSFMEMVDSGTGTFYLNSTFSGTKVGYVFVGWNTSENGSGTHYATGAEYPRPESLGFLCFYAQWVPVTYYATMTVGGV